MSQSKKPFPQREDPFNVVHTARLSKGRVAKYAYVDLPWHAFAYVPIDKKRTKDRERERRIDKLHPRLKQWIAKRGADESEEIVITFRDDLTVPRFPELDYEVAHHGHQPPRRRMRTTSRLASGRRSCRT